MFRSDGFRFFGSVLCGFESVNVREDRKTISAFRSRVPCNARLKRRRRPQTCLRMFQPHEQRPREDDSMFRLVKSAFGRSPRGSLRVSASRPRVSRIPAKRSHKKTANSAPHSIPPQINPPGIISSPFPRTRRLRLLRRSGSRPRGTWGSSQPSPPAERSPPADRCPPCRSGPPAFPPF